MYSQHFGNKADPVELRVPNESKYEKIILMECDSSIRVMDVIYCFAELDYFLIWRMQDVGVNLTPIVAKSH